MPTTYTWKISVLTQWTHLRKRKDIQRHQKYLSLIEKHKCPLTSLSYSEDCISNCLSEFN